MSEKRNVSFDAPSDLVDKFDETVSYPEETRSQCLRDAMRLWVELENPRELL